MLLSRFWYVLLGLLLGAAFFLLNIASNMYNRAGLRARAEALASDAQVVSWYLRDDARQRSAQLIPFALDQDIAKNLQRSSENEGKVPLDARAKLTEALKRVSAQIPKRDEFFLALAKARALPSTADLERLWFEVLREMTETGRVARFQTEVVEANGEKREAEVVRVGAFTALSEGRYLSFEPGPNTLTVLPRQPASALRRLAEGVQQARDGYVRSVVDPSRGVLLALTTQCRFRDCTHTVEPGCAVQAALNAGTLSPSRWQSCQRLLGATTRPRSYGDRRAEQEKKRGVKKATKLLRRRVQEKSGED